MASKAKMPPKRRPATSRGLVREVAYLHPDEVEALARKAERERTSKSDIIRGRCGRFSGWRIESVLRW
ncbi:MAG TPA: ribbon-helix-helix protein, CopG family [Thermoanaerobaculia bacterium]|nr:ribbon-helix-helix protein, CopG family [Thermoanaerobaculia bacterium]